MTALTLLAVSMCHSRPGYAQAVSLMTSTPARYAQLEEVLKLYKGGGTSERGCRWSARNFPMPRPVFPGDALGDGRQGTVVLSFFIYRERAALIKVVDSPHPSLNSAAIEAVSKWRWLPFTVDGQPYPRLTRLTFKFVIMNGEGRVDDPEDLEVSPFSDWWHPIKLRERSAWPEEVTSTHS
jgi:TonB family protein